MTVQITINDLRRAIDTMTSNEAVLVCSDSISIRIKFLTKEDGTIYWLPSYQIGNNNTELKSNMPLRVLVIEFNNALQKYDLERTYCHE